MSRIFKFRTKMMLTYHDAHELMFLLKEGEGDVETAHLSVLVRHQGQNEVSKPGVKML